MAKRQHYNTVFEESKVYHVYNRAINNEQLFLNDNNCEYFLKKYDHYLSDYVDTYAWCLMGNHFHLMIRVKENFGAAGSPNLDKDIAKKQIDNPISNQFNLFFRSYALAFNKQNKRIGSLFQSPFKRVAVENENYFTNLLCYIHNNAVHHGIVKSTENWKWSSYQTILSEAPTKVKREMVLKWFNGKVEFIEYHKQKNNLTEELIIE